MDETQTTEQPIATEQPAAAPADPFALDEARFASLSPEQRASLDPVLSEWKTRATDEISKREKALTEKYKPDVEKATALTQLVQRPEFQQWWNGMQRQAMQGQTSQTQQAIAQTKPQDFATNEEWQQAVYDLNVNSDPTKFKEIQTRMFTMMATPVVQQLRQGQEELKTTLEMKDLFERHPDAKELDLVGRDPKSTDDKSLSLLEMALNWAADNDKSLEDGYQLAKKWADSMKVGAQQQAMGMVQEKKNSTTAGPASTKGGPVIVEVNDLDELMQKSQEFMLDHPGTTLPKFVIKPQVQTTREQRWAQRT